MYSMWNAPSDLDYYDQFNPEPPEEEPEPEDPTPPPELEEQWEAADLAMEGCEPEWTFAPSPAGATQPEEESKLILEVA